MVFCLSGGTMDWWILTVRILFVLSIAHPKKGPPSCMSPPRSQYVCHGGGGVCFSEGGEGRTIRIRIDLLVGGGRVRIACASSLSCFVCIIVVHSIITVNSTIQLWGEKGVPAYLQYRKILTEVSSSIGLVNTEKYQPNTNRKYQISIQL